MYTCICNTVFYQWIFLLLICADHYFPLFFLPFLLLSLFFLPPLSLLLVIWQSVISELQDARLKLDLPFIPFSSDSVYNQFGLSHDLVLQLLEQLPGQEKCSRHDFLFYQPDKVSSWQQTVSKGTCSSLSYLF